MVPDSTFASCVPVLEDAALDQEEKTEKIEVLLKNELSLEGQALEDAVLNVLWRHRDNKNPSKSAPLIRHPVVRSSSPSPWQHVPRSGTPSATGSPSIGRASPAPRASFGGAAPGFIRSKSFGTSSPFGSPRPSPRLAVATPIPHSPSLSNYEFSVGGSEKTDYGDYGSDTVEWLINDDSASRPSSSGAGSVSEGGLNAAATPWIQPQASEMSSYDMLRSVMGDGKSDEEIEAALEANGYDLSATIMNLMGSTATSQEQNYFPDSDGQILIGNHDLSNHICKYWVMGNCLAGDSCIFSHDPTLLMNRMSFGEEPLSTPNVQSHPSFQVQDQDSFPTLQPAAQLQHRATSPGQSHAQRYGVSPTSQGLYGSPRRHFEPRPSAMNGLTSSYGSGSSRPTSRHRSPHPNQIVNLPAVDDTEAFPSLGTLGLKVGKKHHGKRGGHGHSHANKENTPNSLADVVRMSPGPSPGLLRKGLAKAKANTINSAGGGSIPAPQHVPWLETGAKANQEYLKSRQEAFMHGAKRNKFLQSAAQAWNRNDARAAKALSLRGQSENDLMRKAHREAARLLYETRNKDSGHSPEVYVDLHGLHPDEAVSFLEDKLVEQQRTGKVVYAITGTGHHSKNGKDKVGKAVRTWLGEWKYAFREFGAGGAEGLGGILGIDPGSFDRSTLADKERGGTNHGAEEEILGSKVKIVKATDIESDDGEGG
ncbi:uncharacterized protein KY384_008370 [Bacidia gigantensis]|uniref:uncharacterized protein n=1 Tax=Bacidia gigantensis TaxID=2732470 RepID=UPI001D04D5CD|nr:uncharacterized protein KY384_008370 [Bacidia gigantensis]KAG8526941.1 hypothetical protein KY384_008370 [Bacidia gigantensis]